MNIALDLIQPSPHPIRSSWDEGKMQELTDSIKEQGLIVPIKVRPANDETSRYIGQLERYGHGWDQAEEHDYSHYWDHEAYEIVYGHRRAEACRRAGMEHIEAIVEGVEDTNALIQAWIENAQREDMSALDRARALRSIQEMTGWSQAEMVRRGIANNATISHLLLYLKEYEEGAVPSIDRRPDARDEGVIRTKHIRTAFDKAGIDDPTLKRRVHEHTATLPREKVREVAEAVAQAEDEAEREAILSTSPTDPMFDRLVRVRANIHREKARAQQHKREDDPREVRAFLDAVRSFRAVCQEAVAVVEFGKFSPEAKRFAVRQLDQLIADIEALKEELEV